MAGEGGASPAALREAPGGEEAAAGGAKGEGGAEARCCRGEAATEVGGGQGSSIDFTPDKPAFYNGACTFYDTFMAYIGVKSHNFNS